MHTTLLKNKLLQANFYSAPRWMTMWLKSQQKIEYGLYFLANHSSRSCKWRKMSPKSKNERIGITIRNRTLKRLRKHISDKNFSDNLDLSQQDWIVQAILEKLDRENDNINVSQNTLRQISIRIEKKIHDKMNALLAKFKEKGDRSRSFSRKGWILEAIEEKLDRDDE